MDSRNHGRRRLSAGNSREQTTLKGSSSSPDAFNSNAPAATGIGRSRDVPAAAKVACINMDAFNIRT
jgi:hypothetical protein